MAHIDVLHPAVDGIDRYLNVDHKVGPNPDCPNDPSDVEAVQRLLALAARGTSAARISGVPSPTGNFDALTGFFIYHLQTRIHGRRGHGGTVIDGCVSPAHGASYGGGVYSILHLNAIAQTQSRTEWEAILARFSGSQRSPGAPSAGR